MSIPGLPNGYGGWRRGGVGVPGGGGFPDSRVPVVAAEKRAEERSAAIEKRAEVRMIELKTEFADAKSDLKADMGVIADRMERNHAALPARELTRGP